MHCFSLWSSACLSVSAYMEIGVTNISAMIGPYVAPLATATEKVGIPYFVTTPVQHQCYRPFNMITVSPDAIDILHVATQVVSRYHWSNIVVLYDGEEGAWKFSSFLGAVLSLIPWES